MKAIDVFWTPHGNLILVWCPCGRQFTHQAEKLFVICPNCGKITSCHKLKSLKG